ncbi:plantaricin C family lantibiotic [Micromonospora sp. DT228]|uniref:plantaricin C family lantibiotic n=1 Tax=Micromonospora sp. DT228 TaxID=3393443 RepID=UPI003CF7C186
MFENTKFDAAGDILRELTDQEIDLDAAQAAGGTWTIPTTSTIGYVCTVSAECNALHIPCGIG